MDYRLGSGVRDLGLGFRVSGTGLNARDIRVLEYMTENENPK